jgi:hypothetical protein
MRSAYANASSDMKTDSALSKEHVVLHHRQTVAGEHSASRVASASLSRVPLLSLMPIVRVTRATNLVRPYRPYCDVS